MSTIKFWEWKAAGNISMVNGTPLIYSIGFYIKIFLYSHKATFLKAFFKHLLWKVVAFFLYFQPILIRFSQLMLFRVIFNSYSDRWSLWPLTSCTSHQQAFFVFICFKQGAINQSHKYQTLNMKSRLSDSELTPSLHSPCILSWMINPVRSGH